MGAPYYDKVDIDKMFDIYRKEVFESLDSVNTEINGKVNATENLSLKEPGVYRAETSGTIGSVVVKEGYYTLLRKKDDGSWVLESEVKIPMQDLTKIETKVDNFIRDFKVTTDTKFDSKSNNPIANSAVTPLANVLDSFINVNRTKIDTSNSKNGYIKNDGTILTGNENRYIEITDLVGKKSIIYNAYKAVANSNNQNSYSSVLAILNNGEIKSLLGMFNTSNGQANQVKFNETILIPSNTSKLFVGWSAWGVVSDPTIILSESVYSEKDAVKNFIEKNSSILEEKYALPIDLKFDKNYAYELLLIENLTTINIAKNIDNKIGNVCILKLKGGSVSFSSDIILDNGSDAYNPNIGNMIYIIWEYQSARAIIKNSNNNAINNRTLTQTFFADFNVADTTFANYTPNIGLKPTLPTGGYSIVSQKLNSLNTGDNLLTFLLTNSNDYEVSFNITFYHIFICGFNKSSSNINLNISENTISYLDESGSNIILNKNYASNSMKIRGVFKGGVVNLFIDDLLVLSNIRVGINANTFMLGFYNKAGKKNGVIDNIEIKEYL